ncbi:MAG: universal stress protein [Cyanobacteria bacterium SZAS LIN-3]|nr:universal stress protein [Cyanobacteria bacterium SZAS LIN-3]MBS2010957.1 universal stress protein [Cyanobacteria bacterium SZAS TMP-1]
MRKLSILLCLDGSVYSRYAADLCWLIAKNTGAHITAQHVIDTQSAEQFIVPEESGFVEPVKYKFAYNTLHKELYDLAHQLQNSYLVEATKHGVRTDFVIDEGDPVRAICERAKGHDLVIIGHKPSGERSQPLYRRQFLRLSLAEALAHECPRPLLLVQNHTELWSDMTVLVSLEHLNENYVNACLDFASVLDLKPNLTCLTSGDLDEPVEKFIKDFRESDPKVKKVPIEVATLADIAIVDGAPIWGHFASAEAKGMAATLPVIPTRSAAGQRVTVLDGSPTLFVRFLSLPTMLLLPEEHLLETANLPNFKVQSLHRS